MPSRGPFTFLKRLVFIWVAPVDVGTMILVSVVSEGRNPREHQQERWKGVRDAKTAHTGDVMSRPLDAVSKWICPTGDLRGYVKHTSDLFHSRVRKMESLRIYFHLVLV